MRLFNARVNPAVLSFGAVILIALVLWPELLSDLARSSDFMPHGFCFQWQSDILTLHVVSDAVIWLSYIGISGLLTTLIWRFRAVFGQLPLWAGIASGGFIFFCGMTHLMGIIVIWQPLYWLDGGVKALTALASFATFIGGIKFRNQFIQIFTAAAQRDRLLAIQQQAVTQLQAALATRETDLTTLTEEITRQRDERAQVELVLKATELRFRSVFMANPGPKLITRVDNHQIVDANPAFMALSGYPPAELIGQTIDVLDLWPEGSLTSEARALLARDGQLTNQEVPIRTRDGSIRDLLLSVVPVALDNTACFFTVMFDQTDRKRAEAGLYAAGARFQTIIQAAPMAVIVLSPAGIVQLWNPAAEQLLGWQAGEVIGLRVPSVASEEWLAFQALLVRVSAGETITGLTVRRQRRDGIPLDVLFAAAPLRDAEEDTNDVLCLILDLTELEEVRAGRTRLQTLSHRLLQTQEDERRRIARALHDEIGQTLTALMFTLQIAHEDPNLARSTGALEDGIAVVAQLLQQVRTLALDLRPSILDDLGLVAALREYLDRQAQRGGLAGSFRIEGSQAKQLAGARLPHAVEIACFRVAQEALTNVLRHAQARHVSIVLRADDGIVTLLIRDDGVGFDLEAAHARAIAGGSMGLLGMPEQIALISGQFTISAAPRCGTSIQVRFPLLPGKA